MLKVALTGFSHLIAAMLVLGLYLAPASLAFAQGFGGFVPPGPGAGEGTDSENSRFPFQFKLEGVLNPTTPDPNSLATITLTVGTYHEIYKFEVRTAEAPDNPRMSTN